MATGKLYSDLHFKLTIESDGNVKKVYDSAAVDQSIKTILSTVPGERIMLPEFGSRLKSILFEPLDDATAFIIEDEIELAINTWEDRIRISNVSVEADHDRNIYIIYVYYVLRSSGISDSFIGKVKPLV